MNYGILGTVIERVTGERFDVYQREHVLNPLNISGGYIVGNFSDATFEKVGTLYQKKRDGKWDESAPWAAQADNAKIPSACRAFTTKIFPSATN